MIGIEPLRGAMRNAFDLQQPQTLRKDCWARGECYEQHEIYDEWRANGWNARKTYSFLASWWSKWRTAVAGTTRNVQDRFTLLASRISIQFAVRVLGSTLGLFDAKPQARTKPMRADVPGTVDERLKSFLSGKLRLTACGLTMAALLSPLALAQQRSSQPQSASVAVGHHIAQPAAPPTAPSMLDRYLKQLDYEQLQRAVEAMPQSPDRDYFAGVLANRCGRVAESIALLARVLPQVKSSNASRAATALRALAADYMESHRYNQAFEAYEELLHRFATQLDKTERQSVDDDYRMVLLLKNAPPQTISFDGSVDLATHRNAVIDTVEVNLTVNGSEDPWILDTGANVSTVSASFARKLGVQISKDAAQTQGSTGAENKLHIAVLPELKLGGATLRNVVLLVLDDDSLNVQTGKTSRYQINAILGFPVLQALQRVTFIKDGHFLAGPDSASSENGARLYMDGLTPLLECNVKNRMALFSFDTGASRSVFSDRYRRDFQNEFKGVKRKPYTMIGAGGIKEMKAYFLPQVQLGVGSAQPVMGEVPVVPVIGTDMDKLYGNLGRDLVDSYRSFTIDFTNMRLLLAE